MVSFTVVGCVVWVLIATKKNKAKRWGHFINENLKAYRWKRFSCCRLCWKSTTSWNIVFAGRTTVILMIILYFTRILRTHQSKWLKVLWYVVGTIGTTTLWVCKLLHPASVYKIYPYEDKDWGSTCNLILQKPMTQIHRACSAAAVGLYGWMVQAALQSPVYKKNGDVP